MALKVIMLRHKIEGKKAELEALKEKDAEFEAREAELEAAIGETATEEEQAVVSADVDAFDAEKAAHEEAKDALNREIEGLENELSEEERNAPKLEKTEKVIEERSADMHITTNIRELPMNQRAFDAIPYEQRTAILAQEDVKNFLSDIRSMKGQSRAISGGELTIPVTFLDIIAQNMYRYSKLMRHVRVRNVDGTTRQTIAGVVPEAVWTEMCGNLNELTFSFNQVTLDGFKVAGIIPVCNALLEDNDVNLASMLIEMLSESIGLAKDKAILYGKGASEKMPLGIVTRLAQTAAPAGYPASAPAWEDLHTSNIISIDGVTKTGTAFWADLMEACGNTFTKYSRGEQFWAMNSKTYNFLKSRLLTFTANGDIAANLFGVLPIVNGNVEILEFMPDYDIVGGYGDLYLWAQRAAMVVGSDETGYVNRLKDETVFFGKERADGMPVIAGAFVAINIHNAAVTTSLVFAGDNANTVSGIALPATATVAAGESIALSAILAPFGVDGDIVWASSATSKATVSETGVVTGVASGSANITATCNGLTSTCAVTVTA